MWTSAPQTLADNRRCNATSRHVWCNVTPACQTLALGLAHTADYYLLHPERMIMWASWPLNLSDDTLPLTLLKKIWPVERIFFLHSRTFHPKYAFNKRRKQVTLFHSFLIPFWFLHLKQDPNKQIYKKPKERKRLLQLVSKGCIH